MLSCRVIVWAFLILKEIGLKVLKENLGGPTATLSKVRINARWYIRTLKCMVFSSKRWDRVEA